MSIHDLLHRAPLFAALNDADLDWVAAHGQDLAVAAGAPIYAEGAPADAFYVVLDGAVQITKRMEGGDTVLATHEAGGFSGEVPLLMGTPYVASAHATRPTRVLRVGLDDFRQMLTLCSSIRDTIFAAMAARVQGTEAMLRQREKMAALGKLSAGLAHELNNPAAAGHSAANQLRETLGVVQATALRLNTQQTPAQLGELGRLYQDALDRAAHAPRLDPLAESDREDAVATWLDDHAIADGWEMAPALAGADLDPAWLDGFAAAVGDAGLGDALTWLAGSLSAATLLTTIEHSTDRISELVKAVKSYSYMDQASSQEIDIHVGLDNTLTILHHRIKEGVTVIRAYDPALPRIVAYGSELNQVWTNLLDNALDALGGHGEIRIRTARDGECVLVEIGDNGPGIPPAIQARIFEPFFTTKGVGEGSGLGLDICYRVVVTRHHGDIRVESQPGDTRFLVRLPIEA